MQLSTPRIAAGSFHGQPLRFRQIPGLTLTESVYEAGSLARHAHESAFVCLTLGGGYEESIGSKVREAVVNHVAFHPPGEEHAVHFAEAGARCLNIEISPPLMDKLKDTPAFRSPADWRDEQRARLANRIYRELRYWDPVSCVSVEALALELVVDLSRGYQLRGDAPSWHHRVIDKIQSEYLNQISLAELGDLAGLHPVHVARVFRRFERCSVGDYIRRLRVEHARRALVDTKRPIAEIALEAGFSDQSHLTRLMKRSLGITPAALRESA